VVSAHWSGPRRIAHRGAGLLAPENTIAAFQEGFARGYRAVEFDVMLTADGVPVLMHDPTFGRPIGGRGGMSTTAWAELATRDAGAWHSAAFAGERVPTLVAAMSWCRAHGVWMNVEIKPSPGTEALTGRVVGALFAAEHEPKDVLFSSFRVDALEAARAVAPEVPRGLLVGRPSADTADVARRLGCVSVHVGERHASADVVADLHGAGFAVLAYTVVDAARARALDRADVDALFVDRIDLVPSER
jgi:glycerophosphoryl diester phosphodiesterase